MKRFRQWIAHWIRKIMSPKSRSAAGVCTPSSAGPTSKLTFNGQSIYGHYDIEICYTLPPVFNNYTAHYPDDLRKQILNRDARA